MPPDQTLVYAARSVRDAELLKVRLGQAGIEAEVVRKEIAAEDRDGPSVCSVAAGLVVDERDAQAARRLIEQLDPEGPIPSRDPSRAASAEEDSPPQNLKVVYTARTTQQAHMLKGVLAAEGIRAVVFNENLPSSLGIGAAIWAVLPRVAVAAEQAAAARKMALEFEEHDVIPGPGDEDFTEAEATPRTVAAPWPTCPDCGARRSTRCKICGTAGTDFAPVDMGFVWIPDTDDMAAAASCSCGPGGCTSGGSAAAEAADHGPHSTDAMRMCPTCDEPFVPEYPRQCEWCGHEFDDGFEVPQPTGTPEESIGSRVYLVAIGLVALVLALIAYFALVL